MSSYGEIALSTSLREVVDDIVETARGIELRGGNEEDLKLGVEKVLDQKVWKILEVPPPRYEYPIKGVRGASVKHYRLDALYGLAIFEYKVPGTLRKAGEREEAVRKLREEYVPALLSDYNVRRIIEGIREKGLTPRIACVLLDGYNVLFMDYDLDANSFSVEPEVGVYPLDVDRLRKIIRIVIASYRKKLDARTLASDFGFKSRIAQRAVRIFYNALTNPKSKKAQILFEEWRKLVSQAYPLSGGELRKIAEHYGFSKEEVGRVDGIKLFYAIQTYYSLILKLLAAEVAARFYDGAASEYIKWLLKIESEDLRKSLSSLESGFVYKLYKIRNFLEGEMFSWYLNEWSDEVSEVVRGIVGELDEYDVEALTRDLSAARDVFKLLYEELVPREEVRKYLGIYTTPDWLAELILDELGLSVEGLKRLEARGIDPLSVKALDPGVGTGTFLSLIIQRVASYLREKHPDGLPEDVAKRALVAITKNVVGFDIDALALLTAKTNYLIVLAATELLAHKGDEEIEIPIYVANSIVSAEELKDKVMMFVGEKPVTTEVARIPTTAGDFVLPLKLVKSDAFGDFLLEISHRLEKGKPSDSPEVLEVLKSYTKGCASREEGEAWLKILGEFYAKLLKLKEEADVIWIPIIKSHATSATFGGKFDCVVGNPPWIAYRYVADPSYQGRLKNLIVNTYGLVVDEHLMTHMEMATLFFVRALDLYLKDGGLIGFVMPRSIFSSDQHDRFRSCDVKGVAYELLKVADCESVEPLFYVPACAVIAKKGGKTAYPISAVVVSGKLPAEKHKLISLKEAMKNLKLEIKKLHLNRIGARSWLDYREVRLQAERSYYYKLFKQGATIVPQSCWFVDVVDEQKDFLVVRTSKRVKVRGKVGQGIPPLPIERRFVYGVLTSAEVMPFCHLPPNVAVLPIIPAGNGYQMIAKDVAERLGYDYLAGWLEEVERVWNRVRGEKMERMNIYQRLDYQHGISYQNPNVRFKVAYLRSGTHLAATVVDAKRIFEESPLLNGIIIESTLYYHETANIDESFYVIAVLNSNILDELELVAEPSGSEYACRLYGR
jgi:hypothetical protein